MRYLLLVLCLLVFCSTSSAAPCPNGQCTPQVQGEYHPAARIVKRGYRRVGRIWYGFFSPLKPQSGK